MIARAMEMLLKSFDLDLEGLDLEDDDEFPQTNGKHLPRENSEPAPLRKRDPPRQRPGSKASPKERPMPGMHLAEAPAGAESLMRELLKLAEEEWSGRLEQASHEEVGALLQLLGCPCADDLHKLLRK